jgi:YVTN family beta-propeller protein
MLFTSYRPLGRSVCFAAITTATLFAGQACKTNDPVRTEPYDSGVLVLEEGTFQKGNASVSLLNPQTGQVTAPNIFSAVNDRPLGDVLQSYIEIGGKGYLVVNNSDKVEVVENSTFRNIGTIQKGLSATSLPVEQPRYMVAAPPQSGQYLKAYVTCWGGKTVGPNVSVIDLAGRQAFKQITVGSGPEQLTLVGNQVFVANSGGFGVDNTVSVINTDTDQVVTTISVGNRPTSMAYDADANVVYVLCSGKYAYDYVANKVVPTTAELVKINPATRQVVGRITIGGKPLLNNPSNLVFNNTTKTLYFNFGGAIYSTPAAATSIPLDKPLINRNFYGLGVDQTTGTIYGGDAKDFNRGGTVVRYRATGVLLDSAKVGIAPNGFYFK